MSEAIAEIRPQSIYRYLYEHWASVIGERPDREWLDRIMMIWREHEAKCNAMSIGELMDDPERICEKREAARRKAFDILKYYRNARGLSRDEHTFGMVWVPLREPDGDMTEIRAPVSRIREIEAESLKSVVWVDAEQYAALLAYAADVERAFLARNELMGIGVSTPD